MKNFEETATKAFWEAESPELLVFIGVWSFCSENTETFKGNIYISINPKTECAVYTSQLKMAFCFLFEQGKGICQLYQFIWTV